MRKRRFGRVVTAAVTVPLLALIAGVTPGAAQEGSRFTATPVAALDRVEGHKAPTSQMAQTDPALLARNDAASALVVIKLDYDSVATYRGTVKGHAATSPEVTGRQLTGATAAERSYDSYIAAREAEFVRELQRVVPNATIGRSLRVVYGGIAARIPANRVEDVLAIKGVVAVQQDKMNKPLTDSSPEWIGAPTFYDELGTTENAGAGLIYGNLDTGIWPEHPSFADQGNLSAPPAPARECNYGDNPLTPEDDPFVCQNKLIGGAHFTDLYDALAAQGDVVPDRFAGTARDGNGHGSHTASTSAGNIVDSAPVFGVDRGPLHGIAPGAWVMEYKVCGPDGCFDSDTTAAVGQAIIDGVQVINYSISGGTDPFFDSTELAFLDAYAAGVNASTSAGNEGPGAGTANHLSAWVSTVGASTQDRNWESALTVSADNGDTFAATGASIMGGVGEFPVVLAATFPGYANALCTTEAPDGIFEGMIVACERGSVARVWKSFAVLQGGAEGMVLYNTAVNDTETDNHWVPTVHLNQADGIAFRDFMTSHTGTAGSFTAGEAAFDGVGDVMADFSSRGPAGDFIKPDVTAPGVQILAGASPDPDPPNPVDGGSPPGELYQAIAGTSMSSPHMAGALLLVRALHPDWTPGQAKSALMTTATQAVTKEDGVTPADPFDMGSGRIDLNFAGHPGVTFDETAENMAALADDESLAPHLNLPSINVSALPGGFTTMRTATNVSGETLTYTVTTQAPPDTTITVTPSEFTIAPGASQVLEIEIVSSAADGQYFGQIDLDSASSGDGHIPVAFVKTPGTVTLASDCERDQVHWQQPNTCTVTATNNGFGDTTVDIVSDVSGPATIRRAVGAEQTGPNTVELHDAVIPGLVPSIPAIAEGCGPTGCTYLPLADFGVQPIAIGDEDILNFGIPDYMYGGTAYDVIGVDSNGYIVNGGGTSEDNNCCDPEMPSPARPNNVLAPFWTDLDGSQAEGLRVAVLTDGVSDWTVVEWSVNVFGTTSERHFQVWLGANGVEDITFDYDEASLPADPGQALVIGAENEDGSDAATIDGLPTGDLLVTTTPGGEPSSVSFEIRLISHRPDGTVNIHSEMSASGVPGVAISDTSFVVAGPRGGGPGAASAPAARSKLLPA